MQTASPVLLTKLRPPSARRQWVARERLLDRLRHERGTRLTALVAPAGSGKTTLLATWLESEAAHRPVAWVTLDELDNDPIVLWSHVLESLRRACPALRITRTPQRVGAEGIIDAFLPDLVNGLTQQDETALALDDFHRLSGPCRDSVAWLIEHAPPSLQLVISTRTEPALPLATLRAHGELNELRADELGFTIDEADVLLNDRLGLGLAPPDIDGLVERTQGWAAGLYLAGLSLGGVQDRHAAVSEFGGTSRHIIDFLVDEVLEAHDPALTTLMVRCSILGRLCGPLCDAVLEQDGSRDLLEELSRSNLFLGPLDDHGQWYRFHHVFAQLLRVELEHREPGLAATLHRRAYDWHREHGSRDEAISHAIEAAAFAEAGELIAASWADYVNAGKHATVLSWLDRFPDEVLDTNAHLFLIKAWVLSLCGKRAETAEAIAALEALGGPAEGRLPDGFSSIEASLATLRACMPWGDRGSGLANARRAAELEGPGSRYRPVACWAMGMGLYFGGEAEEADRWFAESAELAPESDMWLVAASPLAYRSLVAGEQGRREEQRALAEQAATVTRERGFEKLSGEVLAALGVSLAWDSRFEEALPLLERGVALLRSYGQPIDLANALICQARVLRASGDYEAATAAIAEARATVDSCPDPGALEEWVSALETPPRSPSQHMSSALSEREIAVLRALTGPLSERDIGRELYLSHNTVHSHARSIYRKLGVSSRAEATRRGRELGLL